ncbi:hypothetical protein V6N13_066437 [Hibiscus sabdariffa]|uniref:HP domain-containing protein n=1 Tax=Hibiscus sabdariffa TaxID=183260 RepID=A0ABR2DRY9_9ROSI
MSRAVSMRDLDPAFQGAGQNAYPSLRKLVAFRTFASKSGILRHEIHYWLGKDTSKDEAGAAAIKTIELDAALGGRAVQYREVQGNETDKLISLFKPCILPQEGGGASGFKHVPFARSTLNHDNIFILDTKSKIFQFNGSNTSIQERTKALGVAQYIKDKYHGGKCEIASIEDGSLMADAASGEFWALFGGFAPLPRKSAGDVDTVSDSHSTKKLLSVEKGKAEPVEADSLTRELLGTDKCYILDCGLELYVWMGRNTSLDERKSASTAAEELIQGSDRLKSHLIRVMEGFETVTFWSKFECNATATEDGRGNVAARLQRQGLNVEGILKVTPHKEDPHAHIDCTGVLQVWRVNGQDKVLLSDENHAKFYSGDCFIFHYSYSEEVHEEHLIGTWFGKKSVEKERASAASLARKMVESMKFMAAQACFHEGSEPVLFFFIFQSVIVFKGGLSDGYKSYIAEKGTPDDTYTEEGLALFRVQGTGPENMQSIQVEAVASSLNSSYCYILHSGSTVYTWAGSLTSPDDQELVERQLDLIKPELQTRPQKEGSEVDQFWELLGGKAEHPKKKISSVPEGDPHLFSCTFSKGDLKVTEIYNFTQDDLMAEDIFILDCHSSIFVWVGQEVDTKNKLQASTIGEVRPIGCIEGGFQGYYALIGQLGSHVPLHLSNHKNSKRKMVNPHAPGGCCALTFPSVVAQKFLEHDFLLEKPSRETPMYIVMEGSEPPFFTRFFTWNSAKSNMHGNSFQRKLAIIKHGGIPVTDKPKRRIPFGGRSSGTPEKPKRSRSVSSGSERVRVRGRSPAFNALASTFEKPKDRNLSTPPPTVRKLYPKSGTHEPVTKIADIAESLMPRAVKASPAASKVTADTNSKKNSMSSRPESLSVRDDRKEGEKEDEVDEEGVPTYPYERLKTTSEDPATEIDVTKREAYLSSKEFQEKLGMKRAEFYKLPKWKQNKLKMGVQLF